MAIGKSGLGMLLSHEVEPSSCSLVAAFRYVSLLRIVNFVPHLASCGLFLLFCMGTVNFYEFLAFHCEL